MIFDCKERTGGAEIYNRQSFDMAHDKSKI